MVTTRTEAFATPREVDALDEYSATIPTGKVEGKRWKRKVYIYPGTTRQFEQWYMGTYRLSEEDGVKYYSIEWRTLHTITGPGHAELLESGKMPASWCRAIFNADRLAKENSPKGWPHRRKALHAGANPA